MFGIGSTELILIFLIILLVFGAKRLPEIARALGKSVSEFKSAKDEIVKQVDAESAQKPKAEQEKQIPQTSGKPAAEPDKKA
jgi:sec-independent protein translocase protein TatA